MRISTIPVLFALVFAGCGEGPPAGDDPDLTDTSEPDGPNGDEEEDEEEEDTSAHVEGTVVNQAGIPVVGANLRFCRGAYCRYDTTDEAGSFAFPEAAALWHGLEVVPPQGSGLAVAFAPVDMKPEVRRVVDFVLPQLGPVSPLSSDEAPHLLGEGLEVRLSSASLVPPLLHDPAVEAAGALVSPDLWPPLDGLDSVIAVWYTVPFNYKAADPEGLAFRIQDQWGLLVGGAYQVWVGSYDEATWLDAGTVVLGEDGWLQGDARLPELSTIVLAELP